MQRVAHRALGVLAALLLGAVALVGLALSGAFLAVSTDVGRSFLVPRLVRLADDALAGRIELDSFRLETRGGVTLNGLRVFDPDGDLVLSIERALLVVDAVRPRSRTLVLRVDLDRPQVLLKREEDGSLSLARAFDPTHPSRRPSGPPTGNSAWTLRIGHLAVREGSLLHTTATGATRLEARNVSLEGRGEYGRNGSQVEVKLRSQLLAPAAQAAALDLEGSLRHGALRISVLRAALGESAVEAVAEGDLRRRDGRVAVLAMKLSGAQAQALAAQEPVTGNLSGVAYGESDGRRASAAVDLEAGGARRGGAARAAAAVRLQPGRLAIGFDAALEGLDPSQVVSALPPGSISFTARGRAAGQRLDDLRGALSLSLAPSRLREGTIGPGELHASAAAGHWEVSRLALSLPGAAVEGSGSYRTEGTAAGRLSAEASDLGALGRNLEGLLGTRLPRMTGGARLTAEAEGTAAAPSARFSFSAPSASVGEVAASGVSIAGELRGPRQALQGRLEGSAAFLALGGHPVRSAGLRASVQGRSADLSFTSLVPELGGEPVALRASGELTEDRARLRVSALDFSYPGTRFSLTGPAEVVLEGPSVDRLELASGDQRVAIWGGIRGPTLELGATADALALARLPQRLLPPGLQLDGRLSARASARGRVVSGATGHRLRALVADGHAELADGSVRGVTGLSAAADIGYEQERDHLSVRVDVRRARGGELSASAELPAGLGRAAPGLGVSAQVALRSFPVPDLLRLAAVGSPDESEGEAELEATLAGTVGAPTLSASFRLGGAVYGGWGPGALQASLEGGRAETTLRASLDLRGSRLLVLDVRAPLDLSRLLREPERTARDLDGLPTAASAVVPGFDLSRAAGMNGIPEGISGSIAAELVGHGTWRAPRFQAALDLSNGAYRAYRGLGLHAEARAGDGGVELAARGKLEAREILQLSARASLPLEKLAVRSALEQAPFSLEADVPETALDGVQPSFPVAGVVVASLKAGGTLASPRLDLELRARRLSIPGGRVGDLEAAARYARRDGSARIDLRAAPGGSLHGELRVAADLGLAALRRGGLGQSPAEARLVANGLDLGLLALLVPQAVRSAQGTLDADLRAQGPLSELRPLGTVSMAAQRIAVPELGEWTEVALDASADRDLFRIAKLEAHRGTGWVTARAEAGGLAGRDPARLAGEIQTRNLSLTRAGQDLATIDLDLSFQGTLDRRRLAAEATIAGATVRLPKQSPRPLQSLEARSDIAIGAPKKRGAVAGPPAEQPFRTLVHLLVPNQFLVKSDSPRVDVELKSDLTLEVQSGELLATGTIDVLRGVVEPMRRRAFEIERGRVQFVGGPLEAAALDVTASYENPIAKVQVVVSGTIAQPQIRMTSQPPLDEDQIALLIATGRTELKANSGGVGTLATEEAGRAALGSVAAQLFKDLVAEKLPVDSVAVEPGQLRAGKYVTDKIYVGYTRRFETQLKGGVNQNEVSVEYQISRHWTFESRYGDANSGGASLIWSRDY